MSVQFSPERVNVDQLVENNLRLVYFTINKFFHIPDEETKEEMRSCGYIGLVRAALNYDPDRATFSTYAVRAIRTEISNFFRTQRRHQNKISLDLEFGEDGSSLYNVLSDDSASFEDDTVAKVEAERLLSKLNESERDLIERYFGIGRIPESMEQIADSLGVGTTTISNRIKRILSWLRTEEGDQQ